MKLHRVAVTTWLFLNGAVNAFQPLPPTAARSSTVLRGYLDDISAPQPATPPPPPPPAQPEPQGNVDRFGVGSWEGYVDFGDEFDGGDGQMGVAGDGNKGLSKEWEGAAEMAKSKSMSAKNAWGKTTGYADELIDKGMDTTRAQQLENWKNQQEVQQERNQHRFFTDEYDNISVDEDWRKLASFGVERNQDFDLDTEFGDVVPGGTDCGIIELTGRMNQFQVFEFNLKNPFMGFSDFRARFTADTNPGEWTVEPTEGSLNGRGDPTEFIVKFRPSTVGVSQGYLVVETEDDKWTWTLMGTGSM